jgi:superfamily II DNA or RNA helicase
MELNIEDFLPKYPNINDFDFLKETKEKRSIKFSFASEEEEEDYSDEFVEADEGDEETDEDTEDSSSDYDITILNPYEDNFYNAIFSKKELYNERLSEIEPIPSEKGMLMKHQKIISRFLSSYTMYNELLLVHEMGSGKTCTAIAAIEQIKQESQEGKNNFKGCYIFAKGTNILNNFVKELRDKCTAGQYVPEGYFPNNEDPITGEHRKSRLTTTELNIRTKKLFENFYNISLEPQKPTTFETVAKYIHNTPDNILIKRFSNHILVIDEVHNLRIQDLTDDKISMYAEFKRLLKLVKNCKILLLSGTPMKDEASEIASVMNLILPADKQLPVGSDFENKYMYKEKSTDTFLKVNPDTIEELKTYFKGRVSFLKAMKSSVVKQFVGKPEGELNFLKVEHTDMSEFQTQHYLEALGKDKETEKDKKSGVYYNSRQASLFVFPDGSYGQPKNPDGSINTKKGFAKYIKKDLDNRVWLTQKKKVYKYSIDNDFAKLLRGETTEETINNIEKYSCKYAKVIRGVLNANKCCFVYCDQVTGSGSILLSKLFQLVGFSEASGKEGDSPKLRYILLSSDMTSARMSEVIDMFNSPKNMHGDIIRVIIGSKIVSEGLSFRNIQKEYILTPWFNYSETEQAVYRALRLGSHKDLIDNGETPTVEISHMVAVPLQKDVLTIDQYMYEISELKDISIKSIARVLMESSFDCALNYFRNRNTIDEDNTRDCEYQECSYGCDGIDDNVLEYGIQEDELDKLTYNIYYSNPRIPLVRRRIEKLLRYYKEVQMEFILEKLKEEHTEYEIKNALKTLVKHNRENKIRSIRYSDYIKIYNIGSVKNVMVIIEQLFKHYFKIELLTLKNKIVQKGIKLFGTIFTDFEIVSALKTLIDENVIIYNKYGIPSYLREDNNIYFLVSSVSSPSDFLLEYYSHNPIIKTSLTFLDAYKEIQKSLLPNYIQRMRNIEDKELFDKMIKNFPLEVQEMFIEECLVNEKNEKDLKQPLAKFILEYFSNYIYKLDDQWVSTLLKEEFDVLRCLGSNGWENCDTEYNKKIKNQKQNLVKSLENNKWGYYGKFNPENRVFSIVNVIAQRAKEEKKQLELENLKKMLNEGKITQKQFDDKMTIGKDHRDVFSGRNCREGWSLESLYEIVIKALKIEYPPEYREGEDINTLKKEITENKKLRKIFTDEELEKLDDVETRRALFWGTKQTGGTIQTICDTLENWFKKHNLYILDNQAGTAGGHNKKEDEAKTKTNEYTVQTFIPSKNYVSMKTYIPKIKKVSKESQDKEVEINEKDTNKWILVFNKKKLASFVVVDPITNIIKEVCVSKFASKNNNASEPVNEAINEILKNSCPKNMRPSILIENSLPQYNQLVKLYLSFGFKLNKNDGHMTILVFECDS